ncbi:MAG: biopolymer transporter ExbD [Sinimarinibacterium sp.]|jgi:biopolymer transport protein ExbD
MRLERTPRRRAALALTALVDVVFILLFFFMLAARPAPAQLLELQLAQSADGTATPAPRTLVLRGAQVRWSGRDWPLVELVAQLRAAKATSVELGADPEAALQDLLRVFDALGAAGIRVQIVSAPA